MFRNILTLGETAAVVTETLYALLRRDPPWVPTEVHIVTHAKGRDLFNSRLGGLDGELFKLLKTVGQRMLEPQVHVPQDTRRTDILDIVTEADNVAFADTLTRLIKDLATQSDTVLHVSLSGGRKTMSAYAALAISLFGRDLDELTHMSSYTRWTSRNALKISIGPVKKPRN